MAHRLGNLGPKEQHGGEFCEFSFCLFYPRFGPKEVSNLEILMSIDKIPIKGYYYS